MKRYRRANTTKLMLFIQVVTGHGLFACHMINWNKMNSSCGLCGEDKKTSWHIWKNCKKLSYERDRLHRLTACLEENIAIMKSVSHIFNLKEITELMHSNAQRCK